jgi:hypothetical protein
MKITELLTESQQLQEGPLLNKLGTAVGNAVGTAAKGVGAVAGGVAGLGKAAKKGFQAGKDTVAGAGDNKSATKKTTRPSPTIQGIKAGINKSFGAKAFDVDSDSLPTPDSGDYGQLSKDGNRIWNKKTQGWEPYDQTNKPSTGTNAPPIQQINQQGPTGSAQAKQQTGKAAQALKQTAQAVAGKSAEQAGQTLYAQVKSQVNQLDKKGKQRILQLLQKSLQQAPAAPTQSAAATAQPTPPKRGQPVKVTGTSNPKVARLLQPQTASKENKGTMVAEGFSLYRKH